MHNWCNHKLCIRRNYFNMCYFRFTDDSQMFEHLLIRLWYFLNIVLLAGALLLIGLNIVCLKKSCITIKEKISHVSNKSNAQFRRFFNNTTWKLHVLMAYNVCFKERRSTLHVLERVCNFFGHIYSQYNMFNSIDRNITVL